MDTIDEYRTKLIEIADLAFSHGIRTIEKEGIEIRNFAAWNESSKEKFLIACHDGFKKAQEILISEVLKYQELLRKSKSELKNYRRERNKAKENKIKLTIQIIGQRLHTFSHIADGIAWQLIGSQIHVARRLYMEQDTAKYLDSSNIEHAIEVANVINKNPKDFALISDLTSFVQIGDLLVKHDNKIGIMELKEGYVNNLIDDFFKSIQENKEFERKEEFKEKLNKKTLKQINRMLRQLERASRAITVINKDEGVDPVSGRNIKVSTPKVQTEYFHKELWELQEKLKEKKWAYTVIDNCLYMGMYRDEEIAMAGFAIKQILKKQTDNYIIIDWLSITQNLSEPIFSKPFPREFIIDILIGKVKVILGINFDALIKIWNAVGLKTRWLSTKETARFKQNALKKGMVVINKRGIAVKIQEKEEMIISGGTISKILYDNVRPVNIALSMLSIVDDGEM